MYKVEEKEESNVIKVLHVWDRGDDNLIAGRKYGKREENNVKVFAFHILNSWDISDT